jgi:hypothetical protein
VLEESEMPEDTVQVVLMRGVEGPSLYIDNYRICGNKPWGGGSIIKEWSAQRRDILTALGIKPKAKDE